MKLTVFGYGFEQNENLVTAIEPGDNLFIDDSVRVHHIALRDGGLTLALKQPIETLQLDADPAGPGATNYWLKPIAWKDLPTILARLATGSVCERGRSRRGDPSLSVESAALFTFKQKGE